MDVELKDFEGPLDLLLHSISEYQMDAYDVPTVEVIEQYLAYISTLQAMKLEVTGGYMVMTSQLMLTKSRKLLPEVVGAGPEGDDLKQELLTQIEEYRRFKAIGEELLARHDECAKFYSKPRQELIFEGTVLTHDKTVMGLFLSFPHIMAEKQKELKNSNTVIERDGYRVEDMMTIIVERLNTTKKLVLTIAFRECQTLPEMITIFLATLELIKVHEVEVEQEENFGDIVLRNVS